MTTNSPRVDRLFERQSGRTFMVALDRTLSTGPEPFAEKPADLIRSVIAGGADAMLLGPGLIARFGHLTGYRGAPALVARIDFPFMYGRTQGQGEEFRQIASVEEAVGLGADAVVAFLIGGYEDRRVFGDNVEALGKIASEARRLGTPLIVEAVAWGSQSPSSQDPRMTAEVCRIAAEVGADLVKTESIPDPQAMKYVIDSCPVPVLLLGGPQMPLRELLARTRSALELGARGVVFGRNAWQREDASEAMQEIEQLVHGPSNDQ